MYSVNRMRNNLIIKQIIRCLVLYYMIARVKNLMLCDAIGFISDSIVLFVTIIRQRGSIPLVSTYKKVKWLL